ncbi:MAG: hypothetical protein MI746_18005 [Pseudomonadales bacterium]|nr:hypothetical protein [Pseudomonadales bacterium]
MVASVKAAVSLIGGLFLLIGLAGLFTPEDFASGLGLSVASAEGAGSIRAMIGAHYVAMGGICLYAIIRRKPILLLPVAVIEVVMVLARGIAAINGEFVTATFVPTGIEIFAALVLITATSKLPGP